MSPAAKKVKKITSPRSPPAPEELPVPNFEDVPMPPLEHMPADDPAPPKRKKPPKVAEEEDEDDYEEEEGDSGDDLDRSEEDEDEEDEEDEEEGEEDWISSDEEEEETFADWQLVERKDGANKVVASGDGSYRFLLDVAICVARRGGSVKRTKTSLVVEGSAKMYLRINSDDDSDMVKSLYADVVASKGSELVSESTLVGYLLTKV